jgi:hypothetical protein
MLVQVLEASVLGFLAALLLGLWEDSASGGGTVRGSNGRGSFLHYSRPEVKREKEEGHTLCFMSITSLTGRLLNRLHLLKTPQLPRVQQVGIKSLTHGPSGTLIQTIAEDNYHWNKGCP